MERLGVGKPLVFDTIIPHCLHNILLDRPVLSIVHNILAPGVHWQYILTQASPHMHFQWLYFVLTNTSFDFLNFLCGGSMMR